MLILIILVGEQVTRSCAAPTYTGSYNIKCSVEDESQELNPWDYRLTQDLLSEEDGYFDLCLVYYCKQGYVIGVKRFYSEICLVETEADRELYEKQATIRAQSPTPRPWDKLHLVTTTPSPQETIDRFIKEKRMMREELPKPRAHQIHSVGNMRQPGDVVNVRPKNQSDRNQQRCAEAIQVDEILTGISSTRLIVCTASIVTLFIVIALGVRAQYSLEKSSLDIVQHEGNVISHIVDKPPSICEIRAPISNDGGTTT